MLSPGEWHKVVPKDPVQNLHFRKWLLQKCRAKKDNRLAVQAACRRDILFWINAFVFQYNPNSIGDASREIGPFITWDFQDRALLKIPGVPWPGDSDDLLNDAGILWSVQNRKDLVIEKSREMGASWLCLLCILWVSLFHDHKKFLLISRNAEAVDEAEDSDCLMWKFDFIRRHMPEWMTGKILRKKMSLVCARTESRVNGQASTGKAGVGGRASGAFIDEFSQIREDREVLARTADTTGCRIFNFTHTDVGTAAFDLVENSRKYGVPRRLLMHWTQHPDKRRGLYKAKPNGKIEYLDPGFVYPADYKFVNDGSPTGGPFPGIRSPWYDAECKRRGSSRAVAMDLDIDPGGASSQFYDALTIRRLIEGCREPDWTGEVNLRPHLAEASALESHSDGPLRLWLTPGMTAEGKLLHVPQGKYVIGGDISNGQGATPSCLSIFDCDRGYKVGRYLHRFMDPKQFAYLAVALCRIFRSHDSEGAYLVWETAGPGSIFGNIVLKELNYRHIYWRQDVFADFVKEGDTPGWMPTPDTKRYLHSHYRTALAEGKYVNYDVDSLRECLSYVHKNGTVEHPRAVKNPDPSAQGQNHGDLVVGDALCQLGAAKLGSVIYKKKQDDTPHPNSIAGRRLVNAQRDRESADLWA